MAKPLFLLCLVMALLPFASATQCDTTVYVGDVLTAQGYSLKIDGISTNENGTPAADMTASYAGFQVWKGQVSGTGMHSFTNPLDGTTITITECEAVPGTNGYATVAITGIDFTLVPANPPPRPLPTPAPAGATNITIPKGKNVSAEITIYTPESPDGQKISLPLGETVPAGDYNLRLVDTPSGDTASIEISDSQGNDLGTYDVSTGGQYTAPASAGASPLQLVLQSIAGAEGLGTQAGAQTGTGEALSPEEAAKQQQASNMEALIAILVIFIGMVIASFLVLHYLQRGAVEDSAMKLFENETRAGIMRQLSEADRIPTDLALHLDKSKAAVSEHLETLVQAGLVERIETPGKKFVYYRLTQKGRQAILRMAG